MGDILIFKIVGSTYQRMLMQNSYNQYNLNKADKHKEKKREKSVMFLLFDINQIKPITIAKINSRNLI